MVHKKIKKIKNHLYNSKYNSILVHKCHSNVFCKENEPETLNAMVFWVQDAKARGTCMTHFCDKNLHPGKHGRYCQDKDDEET